MYLSVSHDAAWPLYLLYHSGSPYIFLETWLWLMTQPFDQMFCLNLWDCYGQYSVYHIFFLTNGQDIGGILGARGYLIIVVLLFVNIVVNLFLLWQDVFLAKTWFTQENIFTTIWPLKKIKLTSYKLMLLTQLQKVEENKLHLLHFEFVNIIQL